MEDLNSHDDVEWGLIPPPTHSVPLDVLSALEQDLCENVHGSQFPLDARVQEMHRDGVPPQFAKEWCWSQVTAVHSRHVFGR